MVFANDIVLIDETRGVNNKLKRWKDTLKSKVRESCVIKTIPIKLKEKFYRRVVRPTLLMVSNVSQ